MRHRVLAALVRPGETSAPTSLTILRIGIGVIMLVHGSMKLADVPAWQANVAQLGIPFPEVSAWLAICGEFLGGLGLIFGLMTPIAAFGVLVTMAVAIVTVHAGNGLLASNNGYELPLLLALVAMFFVVRRAGPISLDAIIAKRAAAPTPRRRVHGTPATSTI